MRGRHLSGSLILFLALPVWIIGCPGGGGVGPVPPPTPDASDASSGGDDASPAPTAGDSGLPPSQACSLACAALQAAGCTLGSKGDCGRFLDRDLAPPSHIDNPKTHKALTCLDIQGIHAKADAIALGFACP